MNIIDIIGRILYGGFFVMSGLKHFTNKAGMVGYAQSKGVPMASLAVPGSGLLIILGGLGILFNMYLLISLILVIVFLLPVTFTMHTYWKDTDPHVKMSNQINFYKNLALVGSALLLIAR